MTALADICCASIPAAALPHLGALRTQAGLRITLDGEQAWLRWDAGHDEILGQVLPIAGARLFALHNGLWYQPGRHLPAFDVPVEGESQPLARLVTPSPVGPASRAGPGVPLGSRHLLQTEAPDFPVAATVHRE